MLNLSVEWFPAYKSNLHCQHTAGNPKARGLPSSWWSGSSSRQASIRHSWSLQQSAAISTTLCSRPFCPWCCCSHRRVSCPQSCQQGKSSQDYAASCLHVLVFTFCLHSHATEGAYPSAPTVTKNALHTGPGSDVVASACCVCVMPLLP